MNAKDSGSPAKEAPPTPPRPAKPTTAPAPRANLSSDGASSAKATGAPATPTAKVATSTPFGPNKNVLMVGDSHTESYQYGPRLKEKIAKTGSKVTVGAKSGASTAHFIEKIPPNGKTRIAELIAKSNPDTIVVSLGANFRTGTEGGTKVQVKRLVDAIRSTGSKAQIIWVGPPQSQENAGGNLAPLDRFDGWLEKAAKQNGARYVSSIPLTDPSGSDGKGQGLHLKPGPARAWADKVFDTITGGP